MLGGWGSNLHLGVCFKRVLSPTLWKWRGLMYEWTHAFQEHVFAPACFLLGFLTLTFSLRVLALLLVSVLFSSLCKTSALVHLLRPSLPLVMHQICVTIPDSPIILTITSKRLQGREGKPTWKLLFSCLYFPSECWYIHCVQWHGC